MSQIHDFVYDIGFMTLARTNFSQRQRKKILYLLRYPREFAFEYFSKPISGPPREARQPRLGPWLDFEKYKMVAAAAARPSSGVLGLPKLYHGGPVYHNQNHELETLLY